MPISNKVRGVYTKTIWWPSRTLSKANIEVTSRQLWEYQKKTDVEILNALSENIVRIRNS